MRRSSFAFLFVALLGVLGLSASAVDVPHSFAPGDVISADEVNQNFAAVAQAVTALETVLPGLAATAVGSSDYTRLDTINVPETAASVTIDAPAPGYVRVSAHLTVCTSHENGVGTRVYATLTDVEGPWDSFDPYAEELQFAAALPTNGSLLYCVPMALARPFEVAAAGTLTFYLRGIVNARGVGITNLIPSSIDAVYLPTAYGSVTTSLDAAPSDWGSRPDPRMAP